MKRFFEKLFDIREGELPRALLMFSYIFLVISCVLMLKPIRNSLFLDRFHASELPYVFILVAIVAGGVSTVYSRFASPQHTRLDALIRTTLWIILSNLLLFWLLLRNGYQDGWFIYAFYVWVAIFGAITTSQFWVMANLIFNAREARRLFGFIGAGAISGGIFGGYLTNLARLIGTENLLLLCMGFLGICLVLLRLVWRHQPGGARRGRHVPPHRQKPNENTGNIWQVLKNLPYVRYLAALVGVSVVVANLVDYQFNAVVEENIISKDDRTAFFGIWLSNLSVVSLAIQLFFTRRILGKMGVGPSLLLLPLGIFVGAVAILFFPVLWAAVFIKVIDGSLKQSIHKSGIELLYLPLPADIKARVKAFIDVFVDSAATGLGGILLICFVTYLQVSTASVSGVILVLILMWVLLITRIRREYVDAFRLAIEKRAIDVEDYSVPPDDAAVFSTLQKVLQGENVRQILYVLQLLENIRNVQFTGHLKRLITHSAPEIREQALRILSNYPDVDVSALVHPLVRDPDQNVRTEAICYLVQKAPPEEKVRLLQRFLTDEDYRVRAAALMSAARESARSQTIRQSLHLQELIDQILESVDRCPEEAEQKFLKIAVANAIAASQIPALQPLLLGLLNDRAPEVVQAAALSAGRSRQEIFVPHLLRLLAIQHVRKHARNALAEFGETVIPNLAAALRDVSRPRSVRAQIPRVLGMVGGQKSVDVLIEQLRQADLMLRFEVLRALNRLRKNFPSLKFPEKTIEENIVQETRDYMQTLSVLYTQQHGTPETAAGTEKEKPARVRRARRLLIKALEEKMDLNLERIFRLLGLRYQPQDMYYAYLGITSTRQEVRANAVEFLDNVLAPNLKRFIIPIVENGSLETLMELGRAQFEIQPPDEQECLRSLLSVPDDWLRACALFLIAELRDRTHTASVTQLLQSEDPIVRETAEYARRRLNIN